MNFSFIIVNYRTPNLTIQCIKSVFSNCLNGKYEIILIDNNSADNSVEIIENAFKNIIFIRNKENLGFAKANNQGAKIAKGEYLFFLNSDTIIYDNPLEKMKSLFENDSQIGIIAPKLLNKDGNEQAKAYGPFPTLKYLLFKNLLSPKDNNFPKKTDWVSGAALCIRKNLFNLIGGWDENFFMYLEDVDLCWSVYKAGYKIIRNKNTYITHLQGASLKKTNKKREYYFASQDYLFKKRYGLLFVTILKIVRAPFKTLVYLKK